MATQKLPAVKNKKAVYPSRITMTTHETGCHNALAVSPLLYVFVSAVRIQDIFLFVYDNSV